MGEITKKMILDEDWFVWWQYRYSPSKVEDILRELWDKGTIKEREKIMKLLKG
jgi:hypothetical protein